MYLQPIHAAFYTKDKKETLPCRVKWTFAEVTATRSLSIVLGWKFSPKVSALEKKAAAQKPCTQKRTIGQPCPPEGIFFYAFNKLFCFYFTSDAEKETTVKDDFTRGFYTSSPNLENLESLECVTPPAGPDSTRSDLGSGQKKLTGAGEALKNCFYWGGQAYFRDAMIDYFCCRE